MSTALGGGWRTPVRQGVAAKPLFYYKPPLVMLVLVKDRYDACFNCSLRFAHCSLKKNPAVAGFFIVPAQCAIQPADRLTVQCRLGRLWGAQPPVQQ